MVEENTNTNGNSGNANDVEKILAVVVRRRKTLPRKCMDLHKKMSASDLLRLQNSNVVVEKNIMRENLRRVIYSMKKLKQVQFTLNDLQEAEKKLQTYYARAKEINMYLKKTMKICNSQDKVS